MTDILLGGNFSALYTGKYTNTDNSGEYEFKTTAGFLLSSIKGEAKFDNTSFSSFTNVNVYIKSQGGRNAITTMISQATDGTIRDFSIDYSGWINSVDVNSETLIGIGNPDTYIYCLSSFIDHPFIKMGIEEILLSKKINFTLYKKDSNGNISYLGKRMDQNLKTYGLISSLHNYPSGAVAQTSLMMNFEKEGKYYRLSYPYHYGSPNNNIYLSSSFNLEPLKDSNMQLWEIYINNENLSEILLKNVATGLYLSPIDGKFYNKPNKENEDKFYWSISKGNNLP